MKNIWTTYDLKLFFEGKLCSSVPANPNLRQKWLESRMPEVRPPGGKSIDEISEEVVATLPQLEDIEEELMASSMLVFQRVNGGLAMRANTFRSHLKECARVISTCVGKVKGEKALSTRVINGVYINEKDCIKAHAELWIPVLRDGKQIMEPDDIHEKPIQVTHPRTGQRMSALKAFEYVAAPQMQFTIKVLGDSVAQEDLEVILSYGGTHGYAGERGDGSGKYLFELTLKEKADVLRKPEPAEPEGSGNQRAKGKGRKASASQDA